MHDFDLDRLKDDMTCKREIRPRKDGVLSIVPRFAGSLWSTAKETSGIGDQFPPRVPEPEEDAIHVEYTTDPPELLGLGTEYHTQDSRSTP